MSIELIEEPGVPGAEEYAILDTVVAGDVLTKVCHALAKHSGWWTNTAIGEDTTMAEPYAGGNMRTKLAFNVPEKLCLIHSEISEAMEGFRKARMDDKLPHRTMLEVELADALIRICDLAGAMKLDLGGAIEEKLRFNQQREDHRLEHRKNAEDGKIF